MKVSNKQRVIQIAKNFPNGFTTKDVKEQIRGIPPATMYALLWTMKKAGILNYNGETNVYTAGDLSTPVYKSAKTKTKAKTRLQGPSTVPPKGSYEREISNLTFQVQQQKKFAEELNIKYEDALAIIRYLEDKLFKAIQYNARNGGNS